MCHRRDWRSIIGVDRLLDMARTVLNVEADVVVACIVEERMGVTVK
jgi:Na+/H+-dicarboxylate symporter